MPYGNILLASAIMFSGGSPSQMLNMFQHLKMECINVRTYFRLQQTYLVPRIRDVYQQRQAKLFSELKNECGSVRVAGDGRCCSPDHTAKYGSYSLLELRSGKILDTQLVQVSVSFSPCICSLFYSMLTFSRCQIVENVPLALSRYPDIVDYDMASGHQRTYSSKQILVGKPIHYSFLLLQSNEVPNSNHMELEGLKRAMRKLDEEEIKILHLITDRHSQVIRTFNYYSSIQPL